MWCRKCSGGGESYGDSCIIKMIGAEVIIYVMVGKEIRDRLDAEYSDKTYRTKSLINSRSVG